jgi:hypothetical protein
MIFERLLLGKVKSIAISIIFPILRFLSVRDMPNLIFFQVNQNEFQRPLESSFVHNPA